MMATLSSRLFGDVNTSDQQHWQRLGIMEWEKRLQGLS